MKRLTEIAKKLDAARERIEVTRIEMDEVQVDAEVKIAVEQARIDTARAAFTEARNDAESLGRELRADIDALIGTNDGRVR